MRRRVALELAFVALLLLTKDPAGAKPSKCSSMKLKAAGRAAEQFLKCEAKALASTVSPPVFRDCGQSAGTRLGVGFDNADGRGDCLSRATADDVFLSILDLVGKLKNAVNAIADNTFHGPTICDAKKLRAGGKKGAGKAKCAAKAVRRGGTLDGRCVTKAEAKFATAIGKAEGGSDCTRTGQAAALETIVDAFLEDVVAELTSSTTTTTRRLNAPELLEDVRARRSSMTSLQTKKVNRRLAALVGSDPSRYRYGKVGGLLGGDRSGYRFEFLVCQS